MGTTTAPRPPMKSGVKRMLTLFAAVAIVGILAMAFSVVIGLALLVVAEVFFAMAYRRFSKSSAAASQ